MDASRARFEEAGRLKDEAALAEAEEKVSAELLELARETARLAPRAAAAGLAARAGQAYFCLISLASDIGNLDIAKEIMDSALLLPSDDEETVVYKAKTGGVLLRDYSLCDDARAFFSLYDILIREATVPEAASAIAAEGVSALETALKSERPAEVARVYEMIKNLPPFPEYYSVLARTAHTLISNYPLLLEAGEALAYYKELERLATDPERVKLFAKDGVALLRQFARRGADDEYYEYVRDTFANREDDPEIAVLKAEGIRDFAAESFRSGNFELAKFAVDCLDFCRGDGRVGLVKVSANIELIVALLRDRNTKEAFRVFKTLPKVSPGSIFLQTPMGAAAAMIRQFCDREQMESAKKVFKFMNARAANEKEALKFAFFIADSVRANIRKGFVKIAIGYYSGFTEYSHTRDFILLRASMASSITHALVKEGLCLAARAIYETVRVEEGDIPELQFEKAVMGLDIVKGYLAKDSFKKAAKFWRANADFKAAEKAALKWLKGAENLVETFVDENLFKRALKIYKFLPLGETLSEKAVLRIFAMAMEIIMGLLDARQYASVMEIHDTLPDARDSVKLSEEKYEISVFVLAAMAKRGRRAEAFSVFESLPDSGVSPKTGEFKAQASGRLISVFCAKGFRADAEKIYASLAGLNPSRAIARTRAKAALRIINACIGEDAPEKALELLLSFPTFIKPHRAKKGLAKASAALSAQLAAKGAPSRELARFKRKYLKP
ncbi:MAG: hypothetical protein LBO66_09990 [Deltaproteobacteria bacterium]|nr:hypothetical protein [Deltaproteobacteria bacterium]